MQLVILVWAPTMAFFYFGLFIPGNSLAIIFGMIYCAANKLNFILVRNSSWKSLSQEWTLFRLRSGCKQSEICNSFKYMRKLKKDMLTHVKIERKNANRMIREFSNSVKCSGARLLNENLDLLLSIRRFYSSLAFFLHQWTSRKYLLVQI